MGMEGWKQLVETSSLTSEILEAYVGIRFRLQQLGYSEDMLDKINRVDSKLFSLRDVIAYKFEKLKFQIANYGFEVSASELNDYFQHKFDNINKLIPLENGNN